MTRQELGAKYICVTNWPIKLCTKFGEATVSGFRIIVISMHWAKVWAKGYLPIWANVWAKIISIRLWQIGL